VQGVRFASLAQSLFLDRIRVDGCWVDGVSLDRPFYVCLIGPLRGRLRLFRHRRLRVVRTILLHFDLLSEVRAHLAGSNPMERSE
jgi:hypothetical protein